MPPTTIVAPITVVMVKEKECKGSIRYATDDERAAVSNVYVSRSAFPKMPESIEVSIKAVS